MPHEDNTGGDSCGCNDVGDVDWDDVNDYLLQQNFHGLSVFLFLLNRAFT